MTLEPELIPILQRLNEYFRSKAYRFILIGANVPLILIDLREADGRGYDIRPTRDVDFVVEVDDWRDYEVLRDELAEIGFQRREGHPEHRFFMNNFMADILPYGDQISIDGFIEWPKTGRRMNMAGFDKLFQYAQEVSIAGDLTLPVIPLSLLVFTKIVAYTDRKSSRDLIDILYVLEHFEEITVSERRFEIPDKPDLNYEELGAYLLGMDLAKLLSVDEIQFIISFLENYRDEFAEPVQRLSWECRKKASDIAGLFNAFGEGIG